MKRLLWTCALGSAILLPLCGCASHNRSAATPQTSAALTPNPVAHCHSVSGLPDPACTPGVVRTTDVQSICHGGSTKQFRPPVSYTEALKQQGIVEYGYTDTSLASYEEDHLISLELGGDGFSPQNLWPEPHTGSFNSFQKDQVENWLHTQICSGAMAVVDVQHGVATNWKQYLPTAAKQVPLQTRERQ
ncbi:MAG: hypothetical protein NVSMB3_07460 [Acidobacteriaceae bacterium]